MADKFRKVIPIKISFIDGEAPTSAKLNSLSNQVRSGTALLEKGIGDLWNQSGDAALTDNSNIQPLQIPNIARLIGANAYLNPVWIPTTATFRHKDYIGLRYAGKNTGYLRFRPGGTYTITGDTSSNFSTVQTDERNVNSTGKYWVDATTGKFRIYGSLDSTCKFEYTVDPAATWTVGQETLPGVIPDPGQTEFTSCRVSTSGGKYYLHIPPRRPLTLADRERPDSYPTDSTEISDNTDSIGGGTKKYWQYATGALVGTGDDHYRYPLPKELQDMGLNESNIIPGGLLLLWDDSTKTIVEDVVFKWPDASRENFALEVSSSTYNFASKVTASEIQANYNSTDLILITCGNPLTRSIWNLASSFYKHSHKGEGSGEPKLQHKDLEDLNPPSSSYPSHSTRYPTSLPSWAPSNWEFDEHTSLLSRGGSQGTAGGRNRDINDNAMLGHLVMASSTEVGGNFLNTTADSWHLYFGDTVSGPSLYRDDTYGKSVSVDGSFRIDGTNNINALTVSGIGTGKGITASTINAYGIEINTTIGNYGSLKIIPRATSPNISESSPGSIYVSSVKNKVYHNDTTGWQFFLQEKDFYMTQLSSLRVQKLTATIDTSLKFVRSVNGFVVIGGDEKTIYYQLDAAYMHPTFSSTITPWVASRTAWSIAFGGTSSRYVVVGEAGEIAYSTDLSTWTNATGAPFAGVGDWRGIVWDSFNNLFIICSSAGEIYTSPTGSSWTVRLTGSHFFGSIATDNAGTTIAIPGPGMTTSNTYYRSINGTTWTSKTLPSSSNWASVIWDGTQFLIAEYDGTIYSSFTGDQGDWNIVSTGTTTLADLEVTDLAFVDINDNKIYAMISGNGQGVFHVSASFGLTEWYKIFEFTSDYGYGIGFHEGRLIAVGAEDATDNQALVAVSNRLFWSQEEET